MSKTGDEMLRIAKVFSLTLIFFGCSVTPINFFKSNGAIIQLSTPFSDSGYINMETRVIGSKKEYKAFLSSIETQKYWEHKIEFGMKIAKADIDFQKENLLIYRHPIIQGAKRIRTKIAKKTDRNATILIEEESRVLPSGEAQAFFYKISKKISTVIFKSNKQEIIVKNSTSYRSAIPKECIAWFDGCNHCIRGSNGQALCTKRYCKNKDPFRCIKWQ